MGNDLLALQDRVVDLLLQYKQYKLIGAYAITRNARDHEKQANNIYETFG